MKTVSFLRTWYIEEGRQVLLLAVRIRAKSVRSADGQVKKPGRTADRKRTDNADGQRTDAHGRRTDSGRTMRTDNAPSVRVRALSVRIRALSVRIRALSVRIPCADQ